MYSAHYGVYIANYHNGMKKFKALKEHQVIMTAEEETFTPSSQSLVAERLNGLLFRKYGIIPSSG